ncbi:sensor histidine kinase [Schumannella sp. 10F1B-5-1]|uniref:sensor histidine kinase n=1 Tax=Schumannella sp. 10F1B-5-1 TaxID=2590780 RepID=UPI0011328969|nr:histidine kinase [Schumannella sp. 10F1B-5-1]TPW71706.1 hypothetical protein FJ658_10205 [Schumannella sp. 10F1B-5-1]
MTAFTTAADAISRAGQRGGGRSWLFSVVWGGVYALGLVTMLSGEQRHPWVWALCALGLIAWIVRSALPDRMPRRQFAAELTMIVIGGLVAFEANVLGGVPLAVGLMLVIGRTERPLKAAAVAIPVGIAALGIGMLVAVPERRDLSGVVVGAIAMLVIAVLVGVSRRQGAASAARARELDEQRRRAERLDDHARVARELHDVLAHGLGGLVVQLDAVDALLESGRVDDAATRVRAARELAVAGLHDARRAVDALRGDDAEAAPVAGAELTAALAELVDAHRGLGGEVDARLATPVAPVPAAVAAALRRILQEALSNARKHAAGETVTVVLETMDAGAGSGGAVGGSVGARLVLTVTNPLGAAGAAAATGGGRGLAGMEERVREIDGATLSAGVEPGLGPDLEPGGGAERFVVRAEVPA